MITPDWDVSAAKQLFRLADRGVVPKLPELHPAAWFILKADPDSIMPRFEEWKETFSPLFSGSQKKSASNLGALFVSVYLF